MNAPIRRAAPAPWGPFCAGRCVATLVCLAASLWVPRVSPACLRPPPPLSSSVSVPRVCVSRLPLQRLLPLFPVSHASRVSTRKTGGASSRAATQPRTMLLHGWSAARRDLNLDNLTCTNPASQKGYLRHTSCVYVCMCAHVRSISFHRRHRGVDRRAFLLA